MHIQYVKAKGVANLIITMTPHGHCDVLPEVKYVG